MRRLLIVLGAVAATAGPATAYCTEPSAPSCATGYGNFDDQYEFDRCRSQMTSFQSDVEEFVDCQNRAIRKARDASEEAAREYKSTVDSFNRRARG